MSTCTSTCKSTITPDLSKISSHCYMEQIEVKCLAQFSYYIESDKVACIIDPMREISSYLEILKKRDAKLKYIFETHFHADFVSGHVELAEKTGATIVFGPTAEATFKLHQAKDLEVFELSKNVNIQVMHTPGHTMESSCFVLQEREDNQDKKLAIFTGDTVFLGDVGRPDLACKGEELTSRDLAGYLYESVQKILKLPKEIIIFPGHSAGSACGKNIQVGTASTLELQSKSNYALNENLKKEEFIEILTANIPTPPQYFFVDAMQNRKGIKHCEDIIKKANMPLDVEAFEKILNESKEKNFKDTVVIDCREFSSMWEGFIKGSYCISLDMTYAIWSATLFHPEKTQIALVAPKGREEEAITRLTRVGFDNIIGYLDGGVEAWIKAGKPVEKLELTCHVSAIKHSKEQPHKILDVRGDKEHLSPGYIKNALHIPLNVLSENLSKISHKDEIYMLCKSGGRATIAASILKMHDLGNHLVLLKGGIDAMIKEGFVPEQKK